MRLRARVDKNQKAIVEAARRYGATVHITSQVGKGFPDLVIGYRGKNWLVEVKDGEAPLSQQHLTVDEADWHARWRGNVRVIKSIDELVEMLNEPTC